MSSRPERHLATVTLQWLGLAAATAVLFICGRGAVSDPPWRHADRVSLWWHQHGPLLATLGICRAFLFWIGCCLLTRWTAALIAAYLPRCRWDGWLRRARLPGSRLVARLAMGLTTAGTLWSGGPDSTMAAAQTSTALPEQSGPAPVLRYLGPVDDRVPVSGPVGQPRGGRTPSSPRATPEQQSRTGLPIGSSAAATIAARRRAQRRNGPAIGDPVSPAWWVVQPGDNLWSIAARTLAASWGRPAMISEVAPYWWRVIQVNRPRLTNPNLIFAGDRVILPPLPRPSPQTEPER